MRNDSTTEETLSLPIIKQVFPGVEFVLKDKPDVQSTDSSWGIEVVSAVAPIIREALNIAHNGKAVHDKAGYKFEYEDGYGYIIKNADYASRDVIYQFVSAYIKKLQKLNNENYSGFNRYAVLIYSSLPPLDLASEPWFKFLLECSSASFPQFFERIIVAMPPQLVSSPLRFWQMFVDSKGNISNYMP